MNTNQNVLELFLANSSPIVHLVSIMLLLEVVIKKFPSTSGEKLSPCQDSGVKIWAKI